MNYISFLLLAFAVTTMPGCFPADAAFKSGSDNAAATPDGYSLAQETTDSSDEKALPLKGLGNGPILGGFADFSHDPGRNAYLVGKVGGIQNLGKGFLKHDEDSDQDPTTRGLNVVLKPLRAPNIRSMPSYPLNDYGRENGRRKCPGVMHHSDDDAVLYLRRVPPENTRC